MDDENNAFGSELGRILRLRAMQQWRLGEELGGLGQSTIAGWVNGTARPSPDQVFITEEILELAPGHLSMLLGYLPPSAVTTTVDAAILTDPTLDETGRRVLLAVYRELTSRQRSTASRNRP